jgi:hypothetical protein
MFGGGAIYLVSTMSDATFKAVFELVDNTFEENSALLLAAKGGAIVVEANITPIAIKMTGSNKFLRNKAKFGTVWFAENNDFVSNSTITDATFDGNQNTETGVIQNGSATGTITFNLCNFLNNESKNGSILYTKHRDKTDANQSLMKFESCTFKNNTGSSGMYMYDGTIFSTIETKNCTWTENSGGPAVRVEFGELIDEKSTFDSNKAEYGAAMMVTSGGKATLSGTNFLKNNATDYAGAIYLSAASSIKATNVTMAENIAVTKGGALFMEQNSHIDMTGLNCTKNKVTDKGSCLYILGSKKTTSVV